MLKELTLQYRKTYSKLNYNGAIIFRIKKQFELQKKKSIRYFFLFSSYVLQKQEYKIPLFLMFTTFNVLLPCFKFVLICLLKHLLIKILISLKRVLISQLIFSVSFLCTIITLSLPLSFSLINKEITNFIETDSMNFTYQTGKYKI